MHGQQNIKNGWATIVVVGRLRVKTHNNIDSSKFLTYKYYHSVGFANLEI
jgi:hypothetical protein